MTQHSNFIFNISILFFISCLSIFPITEITIGAIHGDEIVCQSDINISLKTWLITKGIISLINIPFIFLLYLSGKDSILLCILYPIHAIICLFNFAWLITGSIIFWRDCSHLTPLIVNNFMWVSLIFGFITLINSANVSSQENTKSTKPLLDI
jgi:hypothetical protein